MVFKDLLTILHETAYVGRQDIFLLKLLKGSVAEPDKIILGQSTLKGYFQGNNITELAVLLYNAKFSVELLEDHIKNLYELPHKDSPTYNKRYGDKLYKDILYEKAKKEYGNIPYEKTSKFLANEFNNFLKEAFGVDEKYDMPQEPTSFDINDIKEVEITETIISVETNPVDSFMKELKGVIGNLQDIGHKIASRVSNMKSNTFLEIVERTLPSEQKSEIQKGLVKGTHLCSELESEYNKLQGLYDSIDIYNIDHKEQILDEVLKLISKIEMDDFIEKWRKPIIMSVNNQYIFKLDSLIQKYFKDN